MFPIMKDKVRLVYPNVAMLLIQFVVIAFFLMEKEGSVFAFENVSSNLGLLVTTSGDDQVRNFAPGDFSTRILTVHNNGEASFDYIITPALKSGDREFFNSLDLKIVDTDKKILYEGKLRDVPGLRLGTLYPETEKSYEFITSFPAESGNEYQNLKMTYSIVVSAELENQHEGSTSKNNSKEIKMPNTGESSRMPYYLGGIAAIVAGLSIWIKRKQGK